jgi:uncharacterized protein YndB with AHSA1/START domain
MEVDVIRNIHERTIAAPPEDVWDVLATLGSDGDRAWPATDQGGLRLPRGMRPGAPVEHGPLRYRVDRVVPHRALSFRTEGSGSLAFAGAHGFTLTPVPGGTRVRHELRATGLVFLMAWALFMRRAHNDVVESILDNLSEGTDRPAG